MHRRPPNRHTHNKGPANPQLHQSTMASSSSLLRVMYTVQGEEDDSHSPYPNCFLMDRPPSGLLKAHDVLARFPPAAAAAEVYVWI